MAQDLTEDIGGRVSGSPEAKRAVAWGVATFHDAGVDVHTETYTIPVTWSEGASRLTILSSQPFPVRLVSVAWAPATPASGIEAPVVLAGEGTEADFAKLGAAAKGSILLVHSKGHELIAYRHSVRAGGPAQGVIARQNQPADEV